MYPVILQKQNPETEEWTDVCTLHAVRINRAGGGESFGAGREQFHRRLTFDFRWSPKIAEVSWNAAGFRLLYQGHTFNITDYDDYMERHIDVRLVGEAYG